MSSTIRRFLGAGARPFLLACCLSAAVAFAGGEASPADGEPDLVSYSLGHQIGMDLLRQGREVDPAAVGHGLRDGLAGRDPVYPAAELEALLVELKRGIVREARADRLQRGATLRQAGEAFMMENARREGIVALPSGLQYRVIQPGEGRRPMPDDVVRVRYRSTRLDGRPFHDSTGPESEPETLRMGSLIPGLREALPLMAEGARWEIFLPPDLAFGRRGPLADQTVVYDLALITVVSGDQSTEETDE